MSFHLPNNFYPSLNINDLDNTIFNLEKDIDEVDLNIRSNYNTMIMDDNILNFKQEIDLYLNVLKESEHKILFILKIDRLNEANQKKILLLQDKLTNSKRTIELLVRMYDLKSLTKLKTKK